MHALCKGDSFVPILTLGQKVYTMHIQGTAFVYFSYIILIILYFSLDKSKSYTLEVPFYVSGMASMRVYAPFPWKTWKALRMLALELQFDLWPFSSPWQSKLIGCVLWIHKAWASRELELTIVDPLCPSMDFPSRLHLGTIHNHGMRISQGYHLTECWSVP